MDGKIIAGVILLGLGLLFSFNNKNLSKGAFKFYRWLYTESNLRVMFRIAGILLILGGFVLILIKS